jgi:cell wall-associated NlpC family hydrolase
MRQKGYSMKIKNSIILFVAIILASASGAHVLANPLISQRNQTSSSSQTQLDNFVKQGVLGEAEAPSASELRAVSKTKGERALQRAMKQIGYKENPYGSNCNKFSRYFGEGCQAWCGDFTSWAYDLNGDKKLPWVNGSAVINILKWGRKNGHIVKTPRRGDIFIMYGSGYSHVGIVRKPLGSGRFTTVEGNTSNAVRYLVRRDTSYIFFVRVP